MTPSSGAGGLLRRLAALALCAAAATACRAPQDVRSVPREAVLVAPGTLVATHAAEDGRPLVDVEVADHGTLRLLLDTGASVLTIHPDAAARIGLEGQEMREPMLVRGPRGDEWRHLRAGRVEALRFGPAELRGVAWFGIDAGTSDGVLSISALEPFTVTIDGRTGRVSLARESVSDPGDGSVLPYRIHQGVPHATADVAGVPVEVMIDTGFSGALVVPPEIAAKLPFEPGAPIRTWAKDVHGVQPVEARRLDGAIRIGAIRVERPLVGVAPGRCLLGWGALQSAVTTFDPVARLLRVAR